MAIRPILLHPDPRLKTVARPVQAVDDATRRLAQDMLETMYDAPGIGLAAPQVGVLLRLFVMDCAKGDEPPDPLVLVNPEILWTSPERVPYEEGCLSVPDHYAEVIRPAAVELRWTDLDGGVRQARFDGLRAVCVQHEIDHLDGRLFLDHLSPIKRGMITRKMVKLKRDRARDRAEPARA
ncbi:peptide deformylase [Rubellimicrobium sp. CFH 75288]|uniref:peptide deformylase n=1 Tax=Rubellimicrobium sp. CFH 75288 TaxID=2697034 RepID=UPI001411E26D|nr:peptide deformylase [Rubellimicrobium sp. CFH 75288]NAZ38070.1 peptide deformylase [Rubellimicrobium sp. CFH 75288]